MQNSSPVAQLLAMTSSWVKLRLVSQDLNLLSVPEEIIRLVTSYTNRNYTGKDGLDNQRRNLQFRTPLSLTYLPLLCPRQKRNCSPRVWTSAPTPTEVNQVEVSQNLTEYYRRPSSKWVFLGLARDWPRAFPLQEYLGTPPKIVSPLLKPTSRLLVPKLIHLITLSIGFTTTSPESNVRHSSLCVHVRTSSSNQRIRALGW